MPVTDLNSNTVFFSPRLKDFPGKLSELYPDFFKLLIETLKSNHISPQILPDTPISNNSSNLSKYKIYNSLDIWARDYMPIQIESNKYIHYHYLPDYLLDGVSYHGKITNSFRLELKLHLECENLNLILDGGNIIKTDEAVIMTNKVFEENYPLSQSEIKHRLEKSFGLPIIFIPWNKSSMEDVYGHADGVVRYIGNNQVLIPAFKDKSNRIIDSYVYSVYEALLPYLGSQNIKTLPVVSTEKGAMNYNWGYINYLRIGNFILLPQFSKDSFSDKNLAKLNIILKKKKLKDGIFEIFEEIDELTQKQLEHDDKEIKNYFINNFPDCNIATFPCSLLAKEGGVLNCISWTIKK